MEEALKKRILCDKCGFDYSIFTIKRHVRYCDGTDRRNSTRVGQSIKIPQDHKCPYCKKEFPKKGLATHIHRKHLGTKVNYSKNSFLVNNHAWNKGLTKESSNSVRKGAERRSEIHRDGKVNYWYKHSEETRNKIRERALASCHRRVQRNIIKYRTVDGSIVTLDSSWEERVAIVLDKNGVDWIRPKPIQWYDENGLKHNYFPDFYLPKYDVYLDPKNEIVYEMQKEKIRLVKEQNNIKLFILGKDDLSTDIIMSYIRQ